MSDNIQWFDATKEVPGTKEDGENRYVRLLDENGEVLIGERDHYGDSYDTEWYHKDIFWYSYSGESIETLLAGQACVIGTRIKTKITHWAELEGQPDGLRISVFEVIESHINKMVTMLGEELVKDEKHRNWDKIKKLRSAIKSRSN